MTRTLALCLTGALVLAACGGDDDDASDNDDSASSGASEASDESSDDGADAPSAGDASTFRGELEDGTVLTIRLDVAETDPVVAPFVAYREQAGASDPIVWVVGSLEAPADFDDALGPPTGRFITFVPDGGDVIDDTNPTATFACSELDEWFGAPTGDEAVALNEAFVEIVETTCGGQTLQVVGQAGATTDYALIVAGDELPAFGSLYAGLLSELEPVG